MLILQIPKFCLTFASRKKPNETDTRHIHPLALRPPSQGAADDKCH